MYTLEQLLIDLLLKLFSYDQLNLFFGDTRTVATLLGALIAISGALLGTFLLLRGMSLTSDAISHTVLLGIVVAFLVMVLIFGLEPDLSSPLLIIGAALAGVATVVLTELIQRSGLVKADAALGLAFPLLFAIAIILVARFTGNIHLDTDAVMIGEIGVASLNTNSHCYANCEEIVITPEHPLAETQRECTNCQAEDISPRDAKAIFEEVCANCGTYSAAQAWSAGLIERQPVLVFFPKSITVMLILTLLTIGFVLLFYKELKLATFDPALAASLGFRPGRLHYALMIMVSLVAVGAFDAVGSVLVVAFFIIPPAAAYLLTDKLGQMLLIAPTIGAFGAYAGFDVSRGNVLGILQISDVLKFLDATFGIGGYTDWNVSISASMVIMLFVLFVATWVFSPRYGMIATLIRRRAQRIQFNDQIVLGHIYNHEGTPEAAEELAANTLYAHFRWSPRQMHWILVRLRAQDWVSYQDGQIFLTPRGKQQVEAFHRDVLVRG